MLNSHKHTAHHPAPTAIPDTWALPTDVGEERLRPLPDHGLHLSLLLLLLPLLVQKILQKQRLFLQEEGPLPALLGQCRRDHQRLGSRQASGPRLAGERHSLTHRFSCPETMIHC